MTLESENLRRLKQIIKEDGLKAACTYANNLTETSKYQNSELTNSTQDLQKNQKIWKLLATEGLKQLDFDSAEKAFVNSRNLYGIRLVKKLRLENNPKLREGYIYSYLGDFEKAKSRFEQADRLDLIINMELKLNRISMVQVANINSMSSALSDQRQNQCFLKIADNCLMKQDYNQVIAVLGRIRTESLTKDEERLYYRLFVDANVKLARFHELERLAKKLPNDHFMLEVSIVIYFFRSRMIVIILIRYDQKFKFKILSFFSLYLNFSPTSVSTNKQLPF